MRNANGLAIWLALALLYVALPARAGPGPEQADVRVLIDVSGSMKQNDPKNLRRPALRLLVGLMQPGTRAGVWTFAGRADELVARGEVDDAWKRQGTRLAERIGSPGQFTDIEAALRTAVADWRGREPAYRRHVLLLTDGMVDVSRQDADSAASRRRILGELLPELQALSVRVHAVALSGRADHELLRRLSSVTDGWYQEVDAAAELQKAFLRIFEKAGRPDAVPLAGNRFQIDRSVREATVLVFRRPGAEPTRLVAPDGERFERGDIPAGIAWRRDEGYDLITITEPQVGEWTLEAEVDPDNRVMVVTDLKLKLAELPNRIAVGESLPVVAHLTNRGEPISKRAFLELLSLRAEIDNEKRVADLPVNDRGIGGDRRAGDGYFTARLRPGRAAERLDLLVAAESETFIRQQRHAFSVVEPAAVELLAAGDGEAPQVRISIDAGVAEPDGARVDAWQEGGDGGVLKLDPAAGPKGVLQAPLGDPRRPVYVRLEATSRSGAAIGRSYGPLFLPGFEPVAEPEPAAAAQAATDERPPQDRLNKALFAAANLLLLLGGGYWWWHRRRKHQEVVLVADEDAAGDDLDAAFDIGAEQHGKPGGEQAA